MKRFLRKYWLWGAIILFFVVWDGFLAKSSWLNITSTRAHIARLEAEREGYRKRIAEDSTFIENLKDPEFLERFARENLYMVRPGEELYVIEQ